jgi:hypothetical protein
MFAMGIGTSPSSNVFGIVGVDASNNEPGMVTDVKLPE